jgi:hypothetical protein
MRRYAPGKRKLEVGQFTLAKAPLLLVCLAVEGSQERLHLAERSWIDSARRPCYLRDRDWNA